MKKRNWKWLSLALALALCMSVTACSSSSDTAEEETEAVEEEAEEEAEDEEAEEAGEEAEAEEVEEETEAPEEEEAEDEEAGEAGEEAGAYVPGTYTGEADGFGGTVSVTITVDETSITDVTAVGDDETEDVGGAALDELAAQILDAQSADIDGVSGASFTSEGIRAAAQDAIDAAIAG